VLGINTRGAVILGNRHPRKMLGEKGRDLEGGREGLSWLLREKLKLNREKIRAAHIGMVM